MNYKILRLACLGYENIKLKLSKDVQNIKSYKEMKDFISNGFYVYGDSFGEGMQACGNSSQEIIPDFKPLQLMWAKENGIRYSNNTWQTDIVLAQIAKYKPDIIYFQDIHALPREVKLTLKRKFPFIKLLILFRGFPNLSTDFAKTEFSFADLIFVGSPILIEKLKSTSLPKPHLMYHYFDPRILEHINTKQIYDFTFLGTTGYAQNGHSQRYWSLIKLINKTKIELWAEEYTWATDNYNRKLDKASYLKSVNFEVDKAPEYPISFLFPDKCHGSNNAVNENFGLKMYDNLAKSKITFNKHCNAAENEADNMRLFQATGLGTCLLTENSKNIKDLFNEDEIITYNSIDECVEKVNYYLNNDNERNNITKKGQLRTLKDHTCYVRCGQMHDIIKMKM